MGRKGPLARIMERFVAFGWRQETGILGYPATHRDLAAGSGLILDV